MCDYSLHNVKTRPAQVGDKLTTRKFNSGTLQYAYFRGRSCPSPTKLGAYVRGRGPRLSTTRPRSSGKSTKTTR